MNRMLALCSLTLSMALVAVSAGCAKKPAQLSAALDETGAPAASVSAILARADDYVGKTVSLRGNGSAMCEKRRRWLAVTDSRTGQHMRVFTAPAFLLRQLNALHLNEAEGAWTWIADVLAAGLLFLAMSGMLMVRGRKGLSGRGGVLAGLGVLHPLIAVLLL